MKSLPDDPFAFQARVMSALCDDIMDPEAMRTGRFPRMDALREVSRQNPREARAAEQAAGNNHGE